MTIGAAISKLETRNFFPSLLRRERNVQSRGQQHIVLLRPHWWVGDVDISELVLPPEPLADLRHCTQAEREAVFTPVFLEIRVEVDVLGQYRALAQLLI